MRVFAALGLVLGVTLSAPASANGPPLLLGVMGCGELDEREIRRLVAAELGAIPVDQRGPGVTLVTVSCGGLSVRMRVDDPLSHKTVERSFDTSPLDRRARARWIALAASELVLSSWIELEANPTPQVRPQGPEAPAPLRRAARDAVRRRAPPAGVARANTRPTGALVPAVEPVPDFTPAGAAPIPVVASSEPTFRAMLVASTRHFLDGSAELWGGGMRLSGERFSYLSWSFDFLFEGGSAYAHLRDYSLRSGTVGGGLMLYQAAGPVTFRLGGGLRVGVIAALGEDRDELDMVPYDGGRESAVAPWGWPLAIGSIVVGAGPAAVELAMEGGYAVLPVGGSDGGSVRGGWLSAQLGVGIRR